MTEKIRTRLLLPQAGSPFLEVTDPEILSISKILRLAPTDQVACFNGDGMESIYQIEALRRGHLILRLLEAHPNPRDRGCGLHVYIAATKGKTRDRMVRDLPPLGVGQIIFYQADRSIAKLESEPDERLQKIAGEACRQCGRSTIPRVTVSGLRLRDLVESVFLPGQSLLFWEGETSVPFAHWHTNSKPAHLIFGPEGGLSPEEILMFQQKGIAMSSLGQRILRSELAVVVGTTLVEYALGTTAEA